MRLFFIGIIVVSLTVVVAGAVVHVAGVLPDDELYDLLMSDTPLKKGVHI